MEIQASRPQYDQSWTLFLDRDGVVNDEIVGSYVTSWDEFAFCGGALEALQSLAGRFGTIVVVTNQRGVGRGIMAMDDLRDINARTHEAVTAAGGRIDRIYACTAVADTDHNRKPNVGMALQAKEDFPDIDFRRSVMVGNSLSDMEFGKRLAMHTVFLTTKLAPVQLPHPLVNEQWGSLAEWVDSLVATAEASRVA
jgi:histidinol-phosphate phosphatase family protein